MPSPTEHQVAGIPPRSEDCAADASRSRRNGANPADAIRQRITATAAAA